MIIQWLMGSAQNSKRSSIVWNAIGGMFNAGQAAIILIFISYKLGLKTAGMVTISYAIANLFLTISNYGIRNFQVTDTKNKFTFSDYFYCRCSTTIIAFVLMIGYISYSYLLGLYSFEKGIILFEITLLKLNDAFEDVYIGRYQQMGRLDVGAKIMAVRLILSTALISILILANAGIHISLLSGCILSIMSDIFFIKNTFQIAEASISTLNTKKILHLLKVCLPLCIGITLAIFIGNIPKYMIDAYMNEEIQAIFGYIMMPVFVITLLNQFIYQPMIKNLGDLWERKNIRAFKQCIMKQCLIICGSTAIIIAGGLLLGIPVLSLLYNIDLSDYRTEFATLLLGGGFYALAYYLNVPITTIRKQNYIAVGYVVAAVLSFIFGKYCVLSKGMMGAAILYLGINILLVIVYSAVLLKECRFCIKRQNTQQMNL